MNLVPLAPPGVILPTTPPGAPDFPCAPPKGLEPDLAYLAPPEPGLNPPGPTYQR